MTLAKCFDECYMFRIMGKNLSIICRSLYGAQVYLQREDGWSALMISSQNRQNEVIEILLIMMSMKRTHDNMRKHTKQ